MLVTRNIALVLATALLATGAATLAIGQGGRAQTINRGMVGMTTRTIDNKTGCIRTFADVFTSNGIQTKLVELSPECSTPRDWKPAPIPGIDRQIDVGLHLRPQDYSEAASNSDYPADGHSSCADGRSAYLNDQGAIKWCWKSSTPGGQPGPAGESPRYRAVQTGLGIVATALPYVLDHQAQSNWANTVVERQIELIEGAVNLRIRTRGEAYNSTAGALAADPNAVRARLVSESAAVTASTSAIADRIRASAATLPRTLPIGAPDLLRASIVDEILPPPNLVAIDRLSHSGTLRRRGTNLFEQFQGLRDATARAVSDTEYDIAREKLRLDPPTLGPEQYKLTRRVLEMATRFKATRFAEPLLTEARSIRLKATGLTGHVATPYLSRGAEITFQGSLGYPTGREARSLYATLEALETASGVQRARVAALPQAFAMQWPDEPTLGMKLARSLQDLTGFYGYALYNRGDLEEAKRQLEFVDKVLDLSLYSVPYARDAYEAISGKSLYTGKDLSQFDRGVAVAGLMLPYVSRIVAESQVFGRAVKYLSGSLDRTVDKALQWTIAQVRKAGFPNVPWGGSGQAWKDYFILQNTRVVLGQTEREFAPLADRIKRFGRSPETNQLVNLVVDHNAQAVHLPGSVDPLRSVWAGPDPQRFIIDNFDKGIVRENGREVWVHSTSSVGIWMDPTGFRRNPGGNPKWFVGSAVDRGATDWTRIKLEKTGGHVYPDGPPRILRPGD